MDNIKISVIIPIYNGEKYISRCLDSVLKRQENIYVDVICVDDGSTDATVDILNEYKKCFSNLTVVTQENRGLSIARNVGLNLAKGEYVYFVDSDDYIKDNMLTYVVDICESNNLDILSFSFESFGENKKMEETYPHIIFDIKRKYNYDDIIRNGRDMLIKFCSVNEYYVMVWTQIFKRKFLLENSIEFFRNLIYEDNLFTFKALMCASRVICINDILYYKCVRENSIVTSPESIESVRGFLVTIIEEMKYIDAIDYDGNKDTLKNTIEFIIFGLLKQLYKRYYRLSVEQRETLLKQCTYQESIFLKQVLLIDENKLYKC